MTIKFGTDGWRAVISDEFTFANVRHVAQAIAEVLLENATRRLRTPIGRTFRWQSWASTPVSSPTGMPLPSARCSRATGQVVPACRMRRHRRSRTHSQMQAVGGVMITASHNPPVL